MEPPPPRLCDESPVAESSEPKSGKFRGVTRGTPGGAMPGGFPGHSAARGVGAPSGGKSKAGGAARAANFSDFQLYRCVTSPSRARRV